ncbi:type IV pilus modification PilV family protein [Vibrio astriarenae]|uniref:type IV pilus modification PilV family protein n=1 Tax=Vibrio astriarenae TaxID=1481923 RepID=UPI003736CC9A
MIFKQAGFSLIEVLVAFLLIGIAAISLMKLQVHMEQQSEHAVKRLQALRLAENQLEWFRTRGASSALSTVLTADFADIETGRLSSGDYTLKWTVPGATMSGSLKTITITANWQDRLGGAQSVELRTMISRYSEFGEK